MGYYVNPKDGSTKESWLKAHGHQVDPIDVTNGDFDWNSELPVCLVDNGDFTAARIAYDPREASSFMRPDGRPRVWYLVPREALKPFYSE